MDLSPITPVLRQVVPVGPTLVEPPRVLVAEDDGEMRLLLARAFGRKGWRVTTFKDGGDLLDYLGPDLAELASSTKPSLIVCDNRMPSVSGLEVLWHLQVDPRRPPVVLMSAFGGDGLRDQALALGAAAFFEKPFELDDLLHTATALLTRGGKPN